jgi:hypothetical protein
MDKILKGIVRIFFAGLIRIRFVSSKEAHDDKPTTQHHGWVAA